MELLEPWLAHIAILWLKFETTDMMNNNFESLKENILDNGPISPTLKLMTIDRAIVYLLTMISVKPKFPNWYSLLLEKNLQ